jgi:hypothetical protein
MSIQSELNEPGAAPRKVRIARPGRLLAGVLFSLILLPHTLIGLYLLYSMIAETTIAATGIPLPVFRGDDPPSLLGLWFCAAFWNGLMTIIWIVMWGPIFTEYKLLLGGIATTGQVVDKRTFTTGTIAHGVGYEIAFTFPAGKGTMKVMEDCFNKLAIGDPVTVLYESHQPTKSIILNGCMIFQLSSNQPT